MNLLPESYFYLAILNSGLWLLITFFMVLGAIGFFRDLRKGMNGLTMVLMLERAFMSFLFLGQALASFGVWSKNGFFENNMDLFLIWLISGKVLVIGNIILFYFEAKHVKHH